jgi:PAS domain S-box-containing protein
MIRPLGFGEHTFLPIIRTDEIDENPGLNPAADLSLFNESRLPMWIWNLQTFAFLAVNDAAAECYGYSRKEMLAMTVKQLHLQSDAASLSYLSRLPGPSEPRESWRHRRKDGTVLFVEGVRSTVRAGDGNACLTIAIDASETKRSEGIYRCLMDAIPSSVLLIDRKLRVVSANRNFLEKSRRISDATIGKRLSEVFPEVILSEMGLEQQIRNVFTSSCPTQGQRLTYRAPGVPIRVYSYSVLPLNWGDKVEHVLFLLDDVTERTLLGEEIRLMERHLASIVESASDMVVSTDIHGNILTWNRAAQVITGYPFAEVKGQPFFDSCDPTGAASLRKLFSRGTYGEYSGRIESDVKTKNGGWRPVSWVVSRMIDDNRRTVGFVAVGRDLTEQRKFELQILESQKLAALGVMARGIAHEIRTPLAVASSAAQFLLEEDVSSEFRHECAEKVYRGIHKASSIIENLLRFAHPSPDRNKTAVDILGIVYEAVTFLENQARIQNVDIRTVFPEEPLRVLGVPSLIEQVFINLFLNAMNAMPEGGSICISAEQNGSDVMIRVADTGEGISPEDQDKIFDPFYTKAPPGKGIGLGLSICYSIVDQHGGAIGVDSERGKGSTFTMRLPLLQAVGLYAAADDHDESL